MQFQKLTAVPSTPTTPNTLFFVSTTQTPDYVEVYVSSRDGNTLKRVMTEADIRQLIIQQTADLGKYTIVDNIAKRNQLTKKGSVYVKDASGDSTVAHGGAFYIYNDADGQWVKIAEAESMDVTTNWSSVRGKPSSQPSAIDTAVQQTHTHANATELSKIGQDSSGNLTYNGKKVGEVKLVANW